MPLLSLIEDQVRQMKLLKIPTYFGKDLDGFNLILEKNPFAPKLIYMTPEKIVQSS
jgi:hypothetical protein